MNSEMIKEVVPFSEIFFTIIFIADQNPYKSLCSRILVLVNCELISIWVFILNSQLSHIEIITTDDFNFSILWEQFSQLRLKKWTWLNCQHCFINMFYIICLSLCTIREYIFLMMSDITCPIVLTKLQLRIIAMIQFTIAARLGRFLKRMYFTQRRERELRNLMTYHMLIFE